MKRSLLSVCCVALLGVSMSLAGCATDGDDTGDEGVGTTSPVAVGESHQDLTLSAHTDGTENAAEDTGAGPGENPQPQPWFVGAEAGDEAQVAEGSEMRAGQTSIRTMPSNAKSAPEGNPQPQPWFKSGATGGTMTTNQ